MNLDYVAIFKQLNERGIDYIVVGGLAVNFHGIPRMTYDIDLMVHLDIQNILNLVSQLTEWGYRPKAPVDPQGLADKHTSDVWINEKGMKAFNFYCDTQPIGEIDIVIESPIPYKELKKRAVLIDIQKNKIPVLSINDLVEIKHRAGRKQDLSDVESLRKILEK